MMAARIFVLIGVVIFSCSEKCKNEFKVPSTEVKCEIVQRSKDLVPFFFFSDSTLRVHFVTVKFAELQPKEESLISFHKSILILGSYKIVDVNSDYYLI